MDGDSLQQWSTVSTMVLGCVTFSDSSDSLAGFDAMQTPFRLIVFDPDDLGSPSFLGRASMSTIIRISHDRRYVAYNAGLFPGDGCNLILLDRATDSSTCVTLLQTEGMDFSPDGSRLVHPILSGKEVGLWILDVATGERTRLTDGTRR